MQCCSTDLSKISFKFTDKASVFADLSVSKTHFTDKQAFSSDLSVNFCPLWWRFTDKSRFSEHLSVKPGPKRLNFYGQTVHFHRCVRNFAKCSACSIITPSSQSNLPPNYFGLFSSWKWKASCIRKNRMICNYLQIIRFFNLRQSFFPASFCIFRSLDVLQ